MPVVRAIDRKAAKNNFQLSAIVQEIVESVPFEMRRSEEAVQVSSNTAAATNRH